MEVFDGVKSAAGSMALGEALSPSSDATQDMVLFTFRLCFCCLFYFANMLALVRQADHSLFLFLAGLPSSTTDPDMAGGRGGPTGRGNRQPALLS